MAAARLRTALAPLLLIVMLFYLWGVANNLNDILIPQFRKVFTLNDWQSALVQSAFYMGYFLLALPAALFMRRYGYKAAVIVGLILYALGALLFYPAAQLREYSYFLGALFVIASGLAFLETSANPLMTVLGPPEGAAQRLNFAQAFNPAGSITGVFIGREFILSGHEPSAAELAAMSPQALEQFRIAESHAVQGPYMVLAAIVLLWALLVLITPFPAAATHHQEAGAAPSRIRDLKKHPLFLFGVVALFFHVGAQVSIWSFMIRYGQAEVPGLAEKSAADILFWALCAMLAGRFIGTALMSRLSPALLMAIFAAMNLAMALVAAMLGGWTGLMALAVASFFMSIMFPTIFALSIRGLGPLTEAGSAFLVMSIIGGAVVPPLVGLVAHFHDIRVAMGVPALCFLVVTAFALTMLRAGHDKPKEIVS